MTEQEMAGSDIAENALITALEKLLTTELEKASSDIAGNALIIELDKLLTTQLEKRHEGLGILI